LAVGYEVSEIYENPRNTFWTLRMQYKLREDVLDML